MLTYGLETNKDIPVIKYYNLSYIIYPWFRSVTINYWLVTILLSTYELLRVTNICIALLLFFSLMWFVSYVALHVFWYFVKIIWISICGEGGPGPK